MAKTESKQEAATPDTATPATEQPQAAQPVPQQPVMQPAPVAQPNAAVTPIKAFKNVLNGKDVQARLGQLLDEKQKNIFVASALEVFSSDGNLQKCDPMLVMKEVMQAAVFQLPINKNLGYAYVLPYKGVPQFQLGYKAYIQFAMRTGQYRHINAGVVYEGEIKKVDKLSGMIEFGGEPVSDKVVGYFAYFKLLSGFEKSDYISVHDAAQHAIRYAPSVPKNTDIGLLMAKAGKGGTGNGWFGNFDDMAIKTVLKRALKMYGVLSTEMQNAMVHDRDDAETERDGVVASQANAQAVDTEDVQYEPVDEQQPY